LSGSDEATLKIDQQSAFTAPEFTPKSTRKLNLSQQSSEEERRLRDIARRSQL